MPTPWKESYDQTRQHIKKQRHYLANKGPSSQGYGFSSSHVWMWELDHKESWALKNWCFWTVVLEKTLESPLDCKEIQPVHSKGDRSWMFFGRNDAKAETPILWNRNHILQALFITIALGVYFTLLQASEYYEAPFTISDGVYDSTFFVATRFHGLHVIIGSTFLTVCFFRQLKFHFTSSHHFGFKAAAWYWHFVDVVWLFLYVSIYWWGSCPFSINQYNWLPIS